MAFWISLRDQLLNLWNRWTLGQRIGLSAAAVASIGAIIGTVIWASQPEYVVLASQLPLSESADIVGLLDTEKIDYKLNYSGTAVSVASSDLARARLALKDQLGKSDGADPGGLDPNLLFPSPRMEEDRRRSDLERRVEKSIVRMKGIRAATVSVSRPEPSPFTTEQSPVTAAVVIEPNPGEMISSATAQTILTVVARSVPGLTNQNVVLSDTNGRQYGSQEGIQTELGMQLEYTQRLEAAYAHNAESLLAAAQGVRAVVRVTADIDFSQQSRTSNTYDPETKVKSRESSQSSKQDGAAAPPIGTPGSGSNLPVDANKNGGAGKFTNELIETEYENSFVSEVVENLPGKIRRLTVAAIVDVQPAAASGDPNAPQAATIPLLQQQQIENIVKGAVGFDAERNDEVQVILAPLAPEIADGPVATGFVWNQWQPLIQSVSLGLAATLAFLIGMMLMKRMKPIVITETVGPGIPLADARRLASISEQAKAHPDVVASILSAWLNEQEQSAVTPTAESASGRDSNAMSNATVPASMGSAAAGSPAGSASSATGAPAAGVAVPRSSTPNTNGGNRKAA
jgi:flagellar M-ring protein FliF